MDDEAEVWRDAQRDFLGFLVVDVSFVDEVSNELTTV